MTEALAGDEVDSMALLSALGVGIVVVAADGLVLERNERANELVPAAAGVMNESTVAALATEIVDEYEEPASFEDLPVVQALRSGKPVAGLVLGFRDRAGDLLWLLTGAHPEHDVATGELRHVVCSFVDVTDQRVALDAVQSSERRFRHLAENAVDMIFRARRTPELAFEYVNPAVHTVLGYEPAEFYADFALALRILHPDDRIEIEASFNAAVAGELDKVEPVVGRMTRRDGGVVWVQLRVVPIFQGREVVAFEGIVRDITALKAKEADLSYQALHDPLTGLANRSHLLGALEDAIRGTHEVDSGLAVLYVDLDRFKTVNDSFGHETGDAVLTAIAARLADAVRPSDSVARLGGDEFAAVLPEVRGLEEAVQVAHRLLDAIALPVPLDHGALSTTASIGVAFTSDGSETATELLRRADVAMYEAKDRGRARVECFAVPDADARAQDGPG
jgi:diguanylate cyclase (GGDEF)-like protein/PAS domain S-box-containing protein